MNLFGRTWQVQVQAEASDRSNIDDIFRINVRSANGKDDFVAKFSRSPGRCWSTGADPLQQSTAVTIQGSPAPSVSSGQALKSMEEVAARTLPQGYAGEWTDTAFRKNVQKGKRQSFSALRYCLRTFFLSDSTKAGQSRSPCCCRCRWDSWIVCRDRPRPPDTRPLRADRHCSSDWACGKKWHSNRRICEGAKGERASHCLMPQPKAHGYGFGQ